MKLTRRRFLSISAACLATSPAAAQTHRWSGRALGGEVEITLRAPAEIARPALIAARDVIAHVERQFSLFDANSALSRLNLAGRLDTPDPMFVTLMQAAGRIHDATEGLFDPTVQPLWRALAEGNDPAPARALMGWERVRVGQDTIALDTGQALTLNGIAQGFATDLVTAELRRAGLHQTLVNIGEFRAQGGPWQLGLNDPVSGYLGNLTVHDGAIATSSPQAMNLQGQGHILHGVARPQWSTVSVEASDATTADGFSTAFTLASRATIAATVGRFGIRRVVLVDGQGDLTTL